MADENKLNIRQRERERVSWRTAEIRFARITAIPRAISRSGLTKENDYVTQCVGCLVTTAWVKAQNIGIMIRTECHSERHLFTQLSIRYGIKYSILCNNSRA